MDRIVKQIQGAKATKKELEELQEWLKKQDGTINKSSSDLDRAIAQLDPKAHTLGLIHLVSARASMPIDDGTVFVGQCQRLFLSGNAEQARMEAKRCVRISHRLAAIASEYACALRVITCLERAVVLVQENEHQLTGVHADLLQMCILSKCYHRGAELLRRPVLNIGDPKKCGFSQSDYLRFWYYAGLVHTGLKNFAAAIDAFEQCFTAPAMVLSAPAVEAYKKFLLVSLIHHGNTETKRTGNPMMTRNLKSACQRYVDFAQAFITKDSAALAKNATEHAEVFTKDLNWGLVQQCMESLGDRQIRALTQTYLTLSLDTLAKGAGLADKAEAQRRLVNMVEAGTIVASINEKEGMVAFGESGEGYDDMHTLRVIDGNISKAINWGALVRQMDDQIATSSEFVQRSMGLTEARGMGGAGGAGGFDPDMGFGGGFGGFGGFDGMG